MRTEMEKLSNFLKNTEIRDYSFRDGTDLSQYNLISADGNAAIKNDILIVKEWDRLTITNLTPDSIVILTLRNAKCSGHCFVNPNSVQFITFGPVDDEDVTLVVPVNSAGTPDSIVILTLRNAKCSGHCFVNPNSVQFITFGPVDDEDVTLVVPVNSAGHINIDVPPVSDLEFSGYRLVINEIANKKPFTKLEVNKLQQLLSKVIV
ncbi:hypothetical protein F3I56_21010 [Pantoea sp. VH_25]|nr:hypothetical protein F3I56_21010 [Pantoea sp. VH_25]